MLQAVRLSGSLASHRHSCSGETEGRVRRRQSISELSPHQESGSHFPVPSSPPTPLSRLVPPPHVMPSGAVARRTRTRMGLLNAVLGGGGGNGGRAGRHNGRKGTPPPPALPSLRWYLPGAHPPHPPTPRFPSYMKGIFKLFSTLSIVMLSVNTAFKSCSGAFCLISFVGVGVRPIVHT